MELTEKYTEEQIMAAKKTIVITTEIDGQQYTETFDGTEGYAVLTINQDYTNTRLGVSGEGLSRFAHSLLEEIARDCPLALLPIVMGALRKNDKRETAKEVLN
jgi:hypothetical protein